MDKYQSISGEVEGLFKDRGSKFYAYVRPVSHRDEAEELLNELRKSHFKARHHCLAYRIGLDEIEERASDDGEPSGSAGMPILNQLRSAELNNIAAVVVRYFGGTKLGVSGLIHAYKEATIAALEVAQVIQKEVRVWYRLTFDYSIMTQAMNVMKSEFLECKDKILEEKGALILGNSTSNKEEGLKKIGKS